MGKVLLYYKYVNVIHPKRIAKWQQKIGADLHLTGRIIVAHEGINGTVGGSSEDIARYKQIMQKNPLFTDIDFKESDGGTHDFPKLYVSVKPEIVRFGTDCEAFFNREGATHLQPQESHALMQEDPDDLVLFDARNRHEWKIGHFTKSLKADIQYFRDLPRYIDENLDKFKNKRVLMHCTGGIRCEKASAYLESKNVAKKVYQMDGGIHRYTEQYPDGFFRGKNYVFDKRIALTINDDIIAACDICEQPSDEYINCANTLCHKHFICCQSCRKILDNCCKTACKQILKKDNGIV